MNHATLYSFRRCPYAMRARLALKAAGVQVVLREVALRHKPQEMLDASPKATVPVLVLASGEILDESLDIMRWALAQSDPQGWLRQGDAALGEALIARNDGPFKQLLDRYKYAERHPERSSRSWRDEAVALHIAPLEQRLCETPYLLGDVPSLADAALMPFVRQFAEVDASWFAGEAQEGGQAPFPAVQKWLVTWINSALFASVMVKYAPWKTGDVEMYF